MNENQNQLEDTMITLLATIRQVPDSAAGKKALNEFLTLCLQLPGLRRDSHPDYQEALYGTLSWVSENIQKFDENHNPNESFLVNLTRWINGKKLNHLIKDLYRNGKKGGGEWSLEYLESRGFSISQDSKQESERELKIIFEQICRHVEEDATGHLRKSHPRNYPECNCQLLLQRLYFQEPPEKIPTIAREFGLPEQTLYALWRRKCKPYLEILLKPYLDN